MRPVDRATLRVSRRIDAIACADGPPTYGVRLRKHGAWDGPVLWSHQLARHMATSLWLLARRERRWDVVVERGERAVWSRTSDGLESAIDIAATIVAQLRADGRFRPPPA